MRQKGSKYARKHSVYESDNVSDKKNIKVQLSEDDAVIWDILYEPYMFIERFQELTYSQQIGMVVTLNDIIKEHQHSPKTGYEADFAETAQHHLERIHKLTNSSLDIGNYVPIADDEKRLIRMDCYGKINKRSPHQLSPLYTYFKKPENQRRAKLSDYNLITSPSWRVFNQFESFRSIANKVRYYMFKQKINPEALKVMTVNDFCDVIYSAFKENDTEGVARFISPEKNVRVRHIKRFMKNCGDLFEKQLLANGHDSRCVSSLCNALRRFGHCDIDTLIVTETHYTPRILNDLARAGYDVSTIQPGDRIAPSFINELIDEHKEKYILARDENGDLLDKSKLPRLEVHHKHAVQFAASNGYLARANYPNNLLLVESLMHAKYYHLFDQVIKHNQMNTVYSRLNICDPYLASIIGFNPEQAVFYDLEKNPAFRKREEMDKKCVVNYWKMMEERMANELDIVEKYNIPYSSTSIQRSALPLKEMAEKFNHNSENMKKFQKWFTEQKKKNSNGK